MRQKKSFFTIFIAILFAMMFFVWQFAFAATHRVSTSSDFKKWTKEAKPGDIIIVKPGRYSDWGEIKFEADGTELVPITYKASNSGDVTFEDVMVFKVHADWIVIENFDFHKVESPHPYSMISVALCYGSRITNCRFFSCGVLTKSWAGNIRLTTGAKSCRIDNCLFDDAQSYMIGSHVDSTKDWPKDIKIDHNTFQNSSAYCAIQTAPGTTSNGSEETRYIVEYNIFKNLGIGRKGASETICNKSSDNIYRFNTFQDLPSGMLSIRKGNDCRIEGNKFANCQFGIRITGKRHTILNNMFYNTMRAFIFTYGDILEYSGTGGATGRYVASKDCIIAYNTAIGLSGQMMMRVNNAGYAPATIKPSDNTIANNIFVADHDRFIQEDLADNKIVSNIFHAIDKQIPTSVLGTNYILADPMFVDSYVNYRLSLNSPAIDQAVAIFGLEIKTDIDGNVRPRGTKNDIGASELSKPPPKNLIIRLGNTTIH